MMRHIGVAEQSGRGDIYNVRARHPHPTSTDRL
jgi:hypothetical protein